MIDENASTYVPARVESDFGVIVIDTWAELYEREAGLARQRRLERQRQQDYWSVVYCHAT